MFIAMNRFRIAKGRGEEFEAIWRQRDSRLEDVSGFREFHLLKGPEDEEAMLYASHTVWESRSAFEDWTAADAALETFVLEAKPDRDSDILRYLHRRTLRRESLLAPAMRELKDTTLQKIEI